MKRLMIRPIFAVFVCLSLLLVGLIIVAEAVDPLIIIVDKTSQAYGTSQYLTIEASRTNTNLDLTVNGVTQTGLSLPHKVLLTADRTDVTYNIEATVRDLDTSDTATETWNIIIDKEIPKLYLDGDEYYLYNFSIIDKKNFTGDSYGIEIKGSEAGTVYYTLDGTAPYSSSSSLVLNGPTDVQTINITDTTTLRIFMMDAANHHSGNYQITYTKI